jgi:hypothetical protein
MSSRTVTPKVEATVPKKLRDAQVEARAIQHEETGANLVGSVFFLASSDADFLSSQNYQCRRRKESALNEDRRA